MTICVLNSRSVAAYVNGAVLVLAAERELDNEFNSVRNRNNDRSFHRRFRGIRSPVKNGARIPLAMATCQAAVRIINRLGTARKLEQCNIREGSRLEHEPLQLLKIRE